MNKQELQRLLKIEERIMQIATEDLKLKTCPVEFDIVPDQKMLEIMSYNIPTNISNWKYGRDYERLRTINENVNPSLPYEVVINSDPARAYLMKSNTFAVQVLVMAHVIGHTSFFTMNEYFKNSKKDIIDYMFDAKERFNKYEKKYGIDEVEKIVDAAHSLYLHTNPFDNETEEQKIKRIYEQERKEAHKSDTSQFGILSGIRNKPVIESDIELFNQNLWKDLNTRTPVEPTDDILQYIIDRSRILDNWSIDILKVIKTLGQYYWPIINTKFMNEGFAVIVHEYIMNKLFDENILTTSEHAQFNYSNSLVKAENPFSMNPYLIGSKIWEDIIKRWDKGRHGREYEEETNKKKKEEWDTGENKGWEKVLSVLEKYTDWFFMQDFLTPELIKDLKMYVYVIHDTGTHEDYIITDSDAKDIKRLIVSLFSNNGIPKITVVDGNYSERGELFLNHEWSGVNLNLKYAEETMKHIYNIWGKKVLLKTIVDNKSVIFVIDKKDGDFTSDIILDKEKK